MSELIDAIAEEGIRMPKTATAIGGFALGLALAFAVPPAAQADDTSFVRSAKSIGFIQTPPNLILLARNTCNMLWYNNRPINEVEERIQRYMRVSADQAHQFFVLTINEYCPQYGGLVAP